MSSGFFLATRNEVLYERDLSSHRYDDDQLVNPIYGIPHLAHSASPEKRYRGIDREPLQALTDDDARLFTEAGRPAKANAATNRLSEIETRTQRDDGWTTFLKDI